MNTTSAPTKHQLKTFLDEIEAVTGRRTTMLSITEAAAVTGVDRKQLWEDLWAGELPGFRRHRSSRWKINATDLLTYREGHKVQVRP